MQLAAVLEGQAPRAMLDSYEAERRPVAKDNTELSVRNWHEATAVPRALGLDPSAADILQSLAGSPLASRMPGGVSLEPGAHLATNCCL